jgi:hypothetical protein
MSSKLALIPLVGLIGVLFVWGAQQQGKLVNTNMHSTDQSAYMNFAKRTAQTNFRYTGGRNRMPLYPALMSFFYKEGMSDEDFFERGKNVGIAIGLVGLTVAFVLFNRVSKPMDALTGTLVTMFTVFAYKAPYFQAEVLFYTINFLLFYLLLSLVRKPEVRTAVFAGLVGSVGHLTKASVLPAVLLAALLVLVRGVVDLWRRNRNADTPPVDSSSPRFVLNHLCYVTVVLGCFLFVVFPYILQSKARYGHYFYNVNSTFYIWYDSWAETKQGTRAHGDRIGWPDMPADQIPSFQKYVREHSLGEILERFTHGFRDLGNTVTRSYGYAEFLLVYAIALVLLIVQNSVRCLRLLRQVHPSVMLFVVGYFLGYTSLYAWYTPIAGGNRFVLALFLPAMLIIVWALSHAEDHNLYYSCFGRKISASNVSPAVLLLLAAYLLITFPHRISTMYGGG